MKPCTKAVPGWMGKAGRKRVNERRLRIRVAEGQGRNDGGEMGGVVERNLAVGDWVRTKNWVKSKKGLSRWSVPKRITKEGDMLGNMMECFGGMFDM
ncbi:hypothetical protein NDU88_004641 [Pleurodeles waltl]|uniref:Uncharacterized protein n=1 Tax=Pleurodeles waltl TaxID=8319 RepID=A0AAV7TS33_PLEWA|nr:hypothetical protein NDU88_004641 [Pleurodeles waltl]